MVALAALSWLPRWAIAGATLIMLLGHNLFDHVRAEKLGGASWAWRVLREPGLVNLGAPDGEFHGPSDYQAPHAQSRGKREHRA